MADEIDRALGMGLKGVKIHSDMQRVALDDPRLMKLYGLIEGRVPILLHAGDRRFDYSNPDRLVRVLDAFPRLAVVGAHFGGWSVWRKAAQALSGRDLYVDCSSSMYALTPEEIRALVRGYGAHRVLFGSDYPMWNPGREIERLRAAGLEKAEMELILHENARRLLGVCTAKPGAAEAARKLATIKRRAQNSGPSRGAQAHPLAACRQSPDAAETARLAPEADLWIWADYAIVSETGLPAERTRSCPSWYQASCKRRSSCSIRCSSEWI